MASELNRTQLLAAATQVLTASGYVSAPMHDDNSVTSYSARVFEDRYGIVAVCVFDSWTDLVEDWGIAQGQLVGLMSETLRRPEPKSWEGYLVLMTSGLMPSGDRTLINSLRADTNRVRKLVAAGDELITLQDIGNFLLPLVPLDLDESFSGNEDLLRALPHLLQREGVAPVVTEAALQAFAANESILQALHDAGLTS